MARKQARGARKGRRKAAAKKGEPTLLDWFRARGNDVDDHDGLCEEGKDAAIVILRGLRAGKSTEEIYEDAGYDLQARFREDTDFDGQVTEVSYDYIAALKRADELDVPDDFQKALTAEIKRAEALFDIDHDDYKPVLSWTGRSGVKVTWVKKGWDE